jgi:hypothetical protein
VYSETNKVYVTSLWGLWIILAAAIGLASLVAVVQYLIARVEGGEREKEIAQRAAYYQHVVSTRVPSVVTHTASAFMHAGTSFRARQPGAAVADLEDGGLGRKEREKVSEGVPPSFVLQGLCCHGRSRRSSCPVSNCTVLHYLCSSCRVDGDGPIYLTQS